MAKSMLNTRLNYFVLVARRGDVVNVDDNVRREYSRN